MAMAEEESQMLAKRTATFTPSPIQQLSLLAQRRNAINLAEAREEETKLAKINLILPGGYGNGPPGFPDFSAPSHIKEAAISAINAGFNQYRHVQGVCEKVAEAFEKVHGVRVDPTTQITICCGQSEAMAASVLAVVEEGDEVVLLDPAYETYEACIILAGGTPRYVALDPPYWSLDVKKLESAFSTKTKAIIVNSPHNPTGKVFSNSELSAIALLCCKYHCLAITDEVYEHVTFDDAQHISMASFPGMQDRTIVTSSLSKTFSVTGWRVGWAIAPSVISTAIGNIHVKLTDSAPAPFQEAALIALQTSPSFYTQLRQEYKERRNFVCEMLAEAGFANFLIPQGSFFVFAELPLKCPRNDACHEVLSPLYYQKAPHQPAIYSLQVCVLMSNKPRPCHRGWHRLINMVLIEYVTELIEEAGVAIVPGRGFFHQDKRCPLLPGSQPTEETLSLGEALPHLKDNICTGVLSRSYQSSNTYIERYVRIAFCKTMVTLRAARTALRKHSECTSG